MKSQLLEEFSMADLEDRVEFFLCCCGTECGGDPGPEDCGDLGVDGTGGPPPAPEDQCI